LNSNFKDIDDQFKGVVDILQNLKQNTKSEKIKTYVTCKNSAMYLLTKSRYTENKEKRLRILNVLNILLIISVFLIFHYYFK
jgi:hypothetical protein